MYEMELRKPDGRRLTLYSRRPIPAGLVAPCPPQEPVMANPHLRWHPLRGEWVDYAPYRQNRTFLPPPEFNPLAPTTDPGNPTELPAGDYDVAVFDNLFPALTAAAQNPPALGIPTAAAKGQCEVVVFTQDPKTSLGALPADHVELLIEVWGDRTSRLSEREDVSYVLPFENRGAEMGVTLHHPHGQIYAYPFVPPVPQRMNALESEHFGRTGRPLLQELIQQELDLGERLVFRSENAVAFVPPWARYPYEVWVAPTAPVPLLSDLTPPQRTDLARALKTVLMKYDALWKRTFPYLLSWYQAPTDDRPHPETHLHAELWPAYRSPGRLKYLAGTELAAGMFANDTLPEEKAAELRAVEIEF